MKDDLQDESTEIKFRDNPVFIDDRPHMWIEDIDYPIFLLEVAKKSKDDIFNILRQLHLNGGIHKVFRISRNVSL